MISDFCGCKYALIRAYFSLEGVMKVLIWYS